MSEAARKGKVISIKEATAVGQRFVIYGWMVTVQTPGASAASLVFLTIHQKCDNTVVNVL